MKSNARSYVWLPELDGDLEVVAKSCQLCQEMQNAPTIPGFKENILKAYSLEPRLVSNRKAVAVTREAKLSKLVKTSWRYDLT